MKAPFQTSKRVLLWACMWGGGIAWLLHFIGIWICGEFGCISGLGVPGYLGISKVAWLVISFTLFFLGVAGLAFVASWRWCPRDGEVEKFVARCGTVANAFFILVIAAQSLPVIHHLKHCGSAMGG